MKVLLLPISIARLIMLEAQRRRLLELGAVALLSAALISNVGCSLSLSGPRANRPARTVPRCDTGKGLVILDAVFGTLIAGSSVLALIESEAYSADNTFLVGAGMGTALLLSAFSANARVNKCLAAYDAFDLEMSAVSGGELAGGAPPSPSPSRSQSAPPAQPAQPAPSPSRPSKAASPAVGVSTAVTTAVTQPNTDDIKSLARRYVTDGIAAQQEGWFDQAIALYNRAHALAPHPTILFNLGQAHRLKGDKQMALRYYLQFLAVESEGKLFEEAKAWAQALDKEISDEDRASKAEAPLGVK